MSTRCLGGPSLGDARPRTPPRHLRDTSETPPRHSSRRCSTWTSPFAPTRECTSSTCTASSPPPSTPPCRGCCAGSAPQTARRRPSAPAASSAPRGARTGDGTGRSTRTSTGSRGSGTAPLPKTLPRLFRDTSETLPRQFRDTSARRQVPRHVHLADGARDPHRLQEPERGRQASAGGVEGGGRHSLLARAPHAVLLGRRPLAAAPLRARAPEAALRARAARDPHLLRPAAAQRTREGGDVGRCGEMWGDVGRCGEMWGDAGRCGEILTCSAPRLPC